MTCPSYESSVDDVLSVDESSSFDDVSSFDDTLSSSEEESSTDSDNGHDYDHNYLPTDNSMDEYDHSMRENCRYALLLIFKSQQTLGYMQQYDKGLDTYFIQ